MTAHDEALAILRERFGNEWLPSMVFDDIVGWPPLGWRAEMHHIASGATFQGVYSNTELAAARACIAAWDEATRRPLRFMEVAEAAERALADKLAEALEDCGEHQRECPWSHFDAGRPTASGGYEMSYGGQWYEVKPNDCRPKCECGLDATLAAWRERRGKA